MLYEHQKLRVALLLLSRNAVTSISIKGSLEFKDKSKEDKDLYYSLQKVDYSIKGIKKKGKWRLTITVKDVYDFNTIRSFSEPSFGSAANDLGFAMQKIGMMVPYKISVSYKKTI